MSGFNLITTLNGNEIEHVPMPGYEHCIMALDAIALGLNSRYYLIKETESVSYYIDEIDDLGLHVKHRYKVFIDKPVLRI